MLDQTQIETFRAAANHAGVVTLAEIQQFEVPLEDIPPSAGLDPAAGDIFGVHIVFTHPAYPGLGLGIMSLIQPAVCDLDEAGEKIAVQAVEMFAEIPDHIRDAVARGDVPDAV